MPDRGYRAVQAINGIGPISAAVLVAEIGDVPRFPTPAHLCPWVGLTPRHHESDLQERITVASTSKQGSRLGARGRHRGHQPLPRRGAPRRAVSQHRQRAPGATTARIALARKVLTLVYYGLRDGEIRCLAPAQAA